MGQALRNSSPAAGGTYDGIDDYLGERISELGFNGPADVLDQTSNAQPAILATSVAYLHTLESRTKPDFYEHRPAFYAGHSMGQYTAMVAAGVLTPAAAAWLVRERGRLMQTATEGAMAAILGLPEESIPDLLAAGRSRGEFTVANRNSPGQIVVSGEKAAVELAADKARDLGAKRAIILPISVAAHSPLMAGAADGMRSILTDVDFRDPFAPLLANADARELTTGEGCRNELVDHLTQGVDWVAAVEKMTSAGVTQFVEIGPGKVLSGLIKRIAPEAETYPLDDQSSPDGFAMPGVQLIPQAGAAT